SKACAITYYHKSYNRYDASPTSSFGKPVRAVIPVLATQIDSIDYDPGNIHVGALQNVSSVTQHLPGRGVGACDQQHRVRMRAQDHCVGEQGDGRRIYDHVVVR